MLFQPFRAGAVVGYKKGIDENRLRSMSRKIKVGIAHVNKNTQEIVINLKNGKAYTINGFKLSDLMRERVPSVDVLRKPCRRRRS